MVSDGVQLVVDAVVRERLGSDHIVSVSTNRDDDDFADDDTLWVTIVVENELPDSDFSGEIELVRHLRPRLDQVGEKGFPVISFMSRSEAEEAAEAA